MYGGGTCVAPLGATAGEIFLVVFLPEGFAGFDIEAEEVALVADGVESLAIDRGGGGGAAFKHAFIEIEGVLVFPDDRAGLGIEAPDGVEVVDISHGEEEITGDGDGGGADPDGGFPDFFGGSGGELFGGDALGGGAAVVSPVGGSCGEEMGEGKEGEGEEGSLQGWLIHGCLWGLRVQ